MPAECPVRTTASVEMPGKLPMVREIVRRRRYTDCGHDWRESPYPRARGLVDTCWRRLRAGCARRTDPPRHGLSGREGNKWCGASSAIHDLTAGAAGEAQSERPRPSGTSAGAGHSRNVGSKRARVQPAAAPLSVERDIHGVLLRTRRISGYDLRILFTEIDLHRIDGRNGAEVDL